MSLLLRLLTAFALLPTVSACTPSPEAPLVPWTSPYGMQLPDKPIYVEKDELFCYVRKAPEHNARLRRALAEAAVLKLELERISPGSEPQNYTLSRDKTKGLATTLEQLAAVPQWLQLWLYKDADVDPAYIVNLRLLNAEGELLWSGDPSDACYQPHAGAAPISLHAALSPCLPAEK